MCHKVIRSVCDCFVQMITFIHTLLNILKLLNKILIDFVSIEKKGRKSSAKMIFPFPLVGYGKYVVTYFLGKENQNVNWFKEKIVFLWIGTQKRIRTKNRRKWSHCWLSTITTEEVKKKNVYTTNKKKRNRN